ncbi:MAG: hypothetical protein LBD37_03460 [Treponema sp.]|jgi:hypothetical protein|nr:hypothetical protein [Treponema sp.]
MKRGMNINADTAVIKRGETERTLACRVSYLTAGVWDKKAVDSGAVIDRTPYGFCPGGGADIQEGDLFRWRGVWYQVGTVTVDALFNTEVCAQWVLKEVGYGG